MDRATLEKLKSDSMDAIAEVIGAPRMFNDGKAAMRNWFLGRLERMAATQPVAQEPVALSMSSAPKDGTMLRLLVDYSGAHDQFPLEDGRRAWTIGFNNLADTGDDEWQIAGWCWSQDRFTDGQGSVIGWLPFHAHPATPAPDMATATGDRSEIDRLVEVLRTGRHGGDVSNRAADWIEKLAASEFEAVMKLNATPAPVEAALDAPAIWKLANTHDHDSPEFLSALRAQSAPAAVETELRMKAAFIDGYEVGYAARPADELRPWLKETPAQAWETSDTKNTLRAQSAPVGNLGHCASCGADLSVIRMVACCANPMPAAPVGGEGGEG